MPCAGSNMVAVGAFTCPASCVPIQGGVLCVCLYREGAVWCCVSIKGVCCVVLRAFLVVRFPVIVALCTVC